MDNTAYLMMREEVRGAEGGVAWGEGQEGRGGEGAGRGSKRHRCLPAECSGET